MHSMQGRSARLVRRLSCRLGGGEELLTLYGNFGEKAVSLLPPSRYSTGCSTAAATCKDRLRHGELPAGCVALTLRKLEGAGDGI